MIRKLLKQDIADAVAIWYAASIQAHPFIDVSFWDAQKEAMSTVYLSLANSWVYVQNGVIQGFISYANGNVAALFVHPAYQANGIGYALMGYIQAQYPCIRLTVYAKNHVAIAFYERQGFTYLSQQQCEYTGHKENIMQWSKAPVIEISTN